MKQADLIKELQQANSAWNIREENQHIIIDVDDKDWVQSLELLYKEEKLLFHRLCFLTAMKESDSKTLIITGLSSSLWDNYLSVCTSVPNTKSISSVEKVWPIANWFEREIREMFKVKFKDMLHPQPFLLREDLP